MNAWWQKIKKILDTYWLFAKRNHKTIAIALLFSFFAVSMFVIAQLAEPQSLRSDIQANIQQIDTFRSEFQSVSSPANWEPGQPNTLLKSQLSYLQNLDAPNLNEISDSKQRIVSIFSSYEANYQLNPLIQETMNTINSTVDGYYQSLSAIEDYMGFNCVAYLGGQDIGSDEQKQVYIELVDKTKNSLSETTVNQTDLYPQIQQYLDTFKGSIQANNKGELAIPACEQSQKNIRDSFIVIWNNTYIEPINASLSTAISLLNTQLIQL